MTSQLAADSPQRDRVRLFPGSDIQCGRSERVKTGAGNGGRTRDIHLGKMDRWSGDHRARSAMTDPAWFSSPVTVVAGYHQLSSGS
jgi:hypothetical protein